MSLKAVSDCDDTAANECLGICQPLGRQWRGLRLGRQALGLSRGLPILA